MAKTPGKQFEEDFKKSVPYDVYFYRLRDGTASFYKSEEEMKADKNIRFQMTNDYDILLICMPVVIMAELKSYNNSAYSLSGLRKNQIKGLTYASSFEGISPGIIFNIRKVEKTFFVHWKHVDYFMKTETRKSIPNQWIIDNGIEISQWKKVKNYTYDIRKFFDKLKGF